MLALGFEDFPTFAGASIMLDGFFERGGNVFDTAWVYGGGRTEAVLGEWLRARGVRDEVVVIGKGAHSPLTYPDVIGKQLEQSLERLGTDHVDVYFMHRDNPDVPVGEFVDAMDAEAAGRPHPRPVRRLELDARAPRRGDRLREADGQAGTERAFQQLLARRDERADLGRLRRLLRRRLAPLARRPQIADFAWSSQARGFFTDLAGRDRPGTPEIARVWYSEENFARRDRAVELAHDRGVGPLHVALAYVLAQPFQVVPLIGPRRLVELDDSLRALELELTPAEVHWLATGERT